MDLAVAQDCISKELLFSDLSQDMKPTEETSLREPSGQHDKKAVKAGGKVTTTQSHSPE